MNHRDDPRPMEARWLAMGWRVEWNKAQRAYRIRRASGFDGTEPGDFVLVHRRTVDAVEAFVTEHQEVPTC